MSWSPARVAAVNAAASSRLICMSNPASRSVACTGRHDPLVELGEDVAGRAERLAVLLADAVRPRRPARLGEERLRLVQAELGHDRRISSFGRGARHEGVEEAVGDVGLALMTNCTICSRLTAWATALRTRGRP